MEIFRKILFFIKKPSLVLVAGKGRLSVREAIFQSLKPYLKKGKVFILENDLKKEEEIKRFKFLIKYSKLPILVGTHLGEIPPERDFFDGPKKEASGISELAKVWPIYGYLILNFDDETVREIKNKTSARSLTFGFQKGADLKATDINFSLDGTNFKIDYQGKIVPVWLNKLFGKEQIYNALSVVAIGIIKGINLVDLSQALKFYKSVPGKMQLIEGVKKTFILDDSENATVFSMIEALGILKKLKESTEGSGRAIAVLGDVIGVGKYAIEAHETIGEAVARSADLLFTFGPRAKFIAKEAKSKGMRKEDIFEFDTIEEGKLVVQKEIRKGDIILIDGSKEMKMREVVEEIKMINNY